MSERTGNVLSLTGRVAIVTGAGGGLGSAIAVRLAQAGADIVIPEMSEAKAATTAQAVQDAGRKCLVTPLNIADFSDVAACAEHVMAEYGRIDILVNNAGVAGRSAPLWEQSEDDWERMMAVDLKGVFNFCHHVVPHMIKGGWGRIVNIASIAGKEGNPLMGPYSAAKGGVIALTKSLGKELATKGILVNAVAPAVAQTPILDTLSQETIDYMRAKIPMDRFVQPEELAALVHFLVSEMNTFTTGFCFDLTGGRATY